MFVLDTNSIIYYLKDEQSAVKVIDKIFAQNSIVYISVITELELLSFSNLTTNELNKIEEFLQIVAIVPLDSRLARMAANLRRLYKIKTVDSIIAATSLYTGSTLVTRNIKDFQKIIGLKLIQI
jgi:predicted nucleic acid-binding protein